MEGNTIKITKSKKIIISILAAAALAVTSAVAVNAGSLNEAVSNIKLFINGEEVSASDYLNDDGVTVITEDGDEFIFELGNELPEGAEIEMYLDDIDEDTHSSSVAVKGDVNLDKEDVDKLLNQLNELTWESEETENAAAE